MDIARLDGTARVVTICGVLAFINSFLPWYTVSFEGVTFGTANAWNVTYAWIAVLLLLGIGLATALPAFGIRSTLSAPPAVAAVGVLSSIIVLIRWITYPNGSDLGLDAGAGYATYIGLAISLIVAGFGIRADYAGDRAIERMFEAIKRRPPAAPPRPPGS